MTNLRGRVWAKTVVGVARGRNVRRIAWGINAVSSAGARRARKTALGSNPVSSAWARSVRTIVLAIHVVSIATVFHVPKSAPELDVVKGARVRRVLLRAARPISRRAASFRWALGQQRVAWATVAAKAVLATNARTMRARFIPTRR